MKMLLPIRSLVFIALSLSLGGTITRGFYNPTQGRWISRDPIGENQDRNIYAFVRNSPIVGTDSDGRLSVYLVGANQTPCESIDYRFRFIVDFSLCLSTEGYLVQENWLYEDQDDECCGPPISPPPTILIAHFWEAFPVDLLNTPMTFTSPVGDFTDGVTRADFAASSGAYSAIGEVRFFCKEVTGDLGYGTPPPEMPNVPGPEPEWRTGTFRAANGTTVSTGGLPWTNTQPGWWTLGQQQDGPASRVVNVDWDCCPGRPRRWNVSSSP